MSRNKKETQLWHINSTYLPQDTQACGKKLAFSMCLLQYLHNTDEAHIGRNRGTHVYYRRYSEVVFQMKHQ